MFIKNISLKNFGSFKNISLELDKNGFYILHGINKDIEKNDSNENESLGIGKSLFLESILWGVYGETLREGLRENDLNSYISLGEKKAEVDIKFYNNFNIKRIKTRKSHKVLINGKEKTDISSAKKEIESVFITSKLFKFLNFFSPKTMNFFTATPTERYKFIENLLNISILNSLHDNINSEYNENEKKLIELNYKKDLIKNDLSNISNLIKELELMKNKQTIDKDAIVKDRIKNFIQMFITHYSNLLKSYQQLELKYNNMNTELENIEQETENILFHIETLKTKIKELEQKYGEIELLVKEKQKITKALHIYNQHLNIIESYLNNPGKCPLCLRAYEMDIDKYLQEKIKVNNYEELKLKINQLNEILSDIDEYNKYKNELNSLKFKYENIKNRKDKLSSEINSIIAQSIQYTDNILNFIKSNEFMRPFLIEKGKDQYINFIDNFKNLILKIDKNSELLIRLDMLKTEINKIDNIDINNLIEQLKKEISINKNDNKEEIELKIKNYIKNKKEKEEELIQTENKIKEIKEINENLKILLNELGSKGNFKRFIISQYIEGLNEKYNNIIKFLTAKYEISLVIDEKTKGIDVIILNNETGIEKRYGQLSTGEKRLINIGLILTLSVYTTGVLIIDEVMDTLSYSIQLKIIKLLKELNRQIFYVTHNTKIIETIKDIFPDIKSLYFELENDISNVSILN